MTVAVTPRRPVRILFLAWGYSIHAERRIGVFAEDPEFSVVVASPHGYRIPGARTVLLSDARRSADIHRTVSERLAVERRRGQSPEWRTRLAAATARLVWHLRVRRLLRRIGIRRGATARALTSDDDVLRTAAVAAEDFRILRAAVAEFRPDVVCLQTLLYPCYLAFFLPARYPLVITFWNGDVTWPAKWNPIERTIKGQLVAYGLRRAAALTVNSRTALEACLALGASPARVHLIRYPDVDVERFAPAAKEAARRALGIAARQVVLCPRGLGSYLNSDVIVEAAARVARVRPDVLFLFLSALGSTDELAKHRELARVLGIESHVRWEERVPWEAMPRYYHAADAMVSVSSHDSLPNSMLEAIACRIPVIVGDIPPLREWIVDGENGYLVPPRDPERLAATVLELLAAPPQRVASLTRNAWERLVREAGREANGERAKELVRRVSGVARGTTAGRER